MTPPGTLVEPVKEGGALELLNVKYKIFRETIEIQRRWRDEIEAVAERC